MKILIIGGTGLVGPHLVRELFSDDFQVAAVNRSGKSYFTEKSFAADRNNEPELRKAIEEYSPEVIVDMIPFTKKQAEILTRIVNDVDKDIRVVALSSIDIYAAYAKINRTEEVEYQECPLNEEALLRTVYGPEGEAYDKLGIEKAYLSQLANITVLRLPAIYGWPDITRVDEYLSPMLRKEKAITVPAEGAGWRFSRVLHKNAAFAAYLAIQASKKGRHIYNVAEQEAYSLEEWCAKIARICGWKGAIVEDKTKKETDLKQDFYVSSQKIRNELGFYEKYDPEEGLQENVFFSAYQQLNKPYSKEY